MARSFYHLFMSSVLDNMTSAIVMMMLIQKLLSEQRERWIFGSIIIIAANAGGAWTRSGMSPQSCSGSTITLLQVTS